MRPVKDLRLNAIEHQPHELPISASTSLDSIYRTISWRLLPLLMLLYGIAYIDRINVSFAKLQMGSEVGITNTVFGVGAGIFFSGYLMFQVPSNYIVTRVGVRRWVSYISIGWGLVSCGMAFVSGPASFYRLRFLLGIAEAAYFPAVILYLTAWYPERYRGRVMATFLSSFQIAAMVGGPLAGLLMERFSGVAGLKGWQWLFLLEGLAPIILGIAAYFMMVERPANAPWLTAGEKDSIQRETSFALHATDKKFAAAFKNIRTYVFGLGYFTIIFASYVLTFWMPTLIRSVGVVRISTIGYFSAIPSAVAIISMWLVGKISDKRGGRVAYTLVGALLGAVGLFAIPLVLGKLWLTLAVLCSANAGLCFAVSTFWAIPGSYRSGPEAAAGIAIINTLGALGGFVGPALMGWITDASGAVNSGLYMTVVLLLIGVGLLLAGSSAGQYERQV